VAGETQQPGRLGVFYVVLDMGMAAVTGLQVDDVRVSRVGDEALVAPAVGVEQGNP
jgi:hypothetical protein